MCDIMETILISACVDYSCTYGYADVHFYLYLSSQKLQDEVFDL